MTSGNNFYSVSETPLFVTQYFWKFRAPNAEELIEFVNNPGEPIDNDYYRFGGNCYFDCIPLKKAKTYKDLIRPSLRVLMKYWKISKLRLSTAGGWICHYNYGNHQEIHHHGDEDLVSVFFANDGPDFAKFYFYDRMSVLDSKFWRQIFPEQHAGEWVVPKVRAGDIIFFPGKIMHGVTPHMSNVTRKTLAVNFNAKPLARRLGKDP